MSVVVKGKTLLTYSDYVLLPDDGRQHEIIRGEHYVTPSPITKHQTVSRRILVQLYKAIEEPGHGVVIYSPMDLVLSDIDVVQPDLMVVLKKNRSIVKIKNVEGVPDLVVEITSPSTMNKDLKLKKSLYQRHGVPEYWIVHTNQDLIEKFVTAKSGYRLAGRFKDRIEFSGFPEAVVDLTKVW